jgi:hypothetical protein
MKKGKRQRPPRKLPNEDDTQDKQSEADFGPPPRRTKPI